MTNMDFEDIRAPISSRAEVFQVGIKSLSYAFSIKIMEEDKELKKIFGSLKERYSTLEELEQAYNDGAQWCSAGWLIDNNNNNPIIGYPMQTSHNGCGNKKGVILWGGITDETKANITITHHKALFHFYINHQQEQLSKKYKLNILNWYEHLSDQTPSIKKFSKYSMEELYITNIPITIPINVMAQNLNGSTMRILQRIHTLINHMYENKMEFYVITTADNYGFNPDAFKYFINKIFPEKHKQLLQIEDNPSLYFENGNRLELTEQELQILYNTGMQCLFPFAIKASRFVNYYKIIQHNTPQIIKWDSIEKEKRGIDGSNSGKLSNMLITSGAVIIYGEKPSIKEVNEYNSETEAKIKIIPFYQKSSPSDPLESRWSFFDELPLEPQRLQNQFIGFDVKNNKYIPKYVENLPKIEIIPRISDPPQNMPEEIFIVRINDTSKNYYSNGDNNINNVFYDYIPIYVWKFVESYLRLDSSISYDNIKIAVPEMVLSQYYQYGGEAKFLFVFGEKYDKIGYIGDGDKNLVFNNGLVYWNLNDEKPDQVVKLRCDRFLLMTKKPAKPDFVPGFIIEPFNSSKYSMYDV
jgi:hypothetical protein